MSFFKNLFKKEVKFPLISAFYAGIRSAFSGRSNRDYYQGWVFACVRAIIEDVALIQFKLFKFDTKGNKELIISHPVLDLLNKPSRFFTKYEIIERLQANLELSGEEFWFVEPDKSGTPIEIYPLIPSCVTPIADPMTYVKGYKYRIDSQEFILPKEFVIHFKNFNPKSDITGKSTIDAIRTVADTDEAAKEYNKSFFENSATPGVILKYPGALTDAQQTKMMSSWEDSFKGFKNAYRTAIAQGGLDIEKLEMSHADMEYLEGRKWNRDEILGIFRVPKTVLGIVEDVNFASAKAANYIFALRNIKPKMKRLVDTLTTALLPLYGEIGYLIDFENPVPEDVQEQTVAFTAGINNGWLCHNDVRRSLGLPEIDNGDQFYLPFSLTPFSSSVRKSVTRVEVIEKSEVVKKFASEVTDAFMGSFKTIIKAERPDDFKKRGDQKILSLKARLPSYEKLFAKTSEKLFEGQLERAIKKLNQLDLKSIKKKIPDLLNEEDEIGATIDLFTPLFGDLTESEARQAFKDLGLNPDDFKVDAEVRDMISANLKKFAGVATKTTTAEIRAHVIAGYEQGEGAAKIAQRLRESFTFSKGRAERIARTEVIRGSAAAEKQAWVQSKVVKAMQWYTSPDCVDECNDLNAKKVPLDGVFIPEKDLDNSYDGDLTQPPLHPNCRCTLLPIVE